MKTMAMPSLRSLCMTSKSCADLALGEARGRLVQDEDLGGGDVERSGDGRHLLDRDRVRAELSGHVDVDVQAGRGISARLAFIAFQSTMRHPTSSGARPMSTFSATVRLGQRLTSW